MEEEAEAVRDFWEGKGFSEEELDSEASGALARRAGDALQKAVNTGRDRVSNLTPRGRIIAGTALLGVAADATAAR